MKRNVIIVLFILTLVGAIDAGYLTWEHYQTSNVLPCYYNSHLPAFFSDCGKVLSSKYSVVFGIPLAAIGLLHYAILGSVILLALFTKKRFWRYWIMVETTGGAFFSVIFVYLMLFVIQGFCQYCFLSALVSFIIFYIAYRYLDKERKGLVIYIGGYIYQNILKRVFFLIDPEAIHILLANTGEMLGSNFLTKWLTRQLLPIQDKKLSQKINGIAFNNPVGLAAGFDYEAWLPRILPDIGFGFGTVGTITNNAYEGNPPPRLGRLPKSRSLLVNKGFKNPGAKKIFEKLKNKKFGIPVGISIGMTNSPELSNQKQCIEDIVNAFKIFEKSKVGSSYYELNISCPNLIHAGNINFYDPVKLNSLLTAVNKLSVKKPVFIKMPIDKTDKEIKTMLDIIVKYNFVKGVIFGNLQKNRKDKSLIPSEVAKFKTGYFSGKPTEVRSNELIELAYKNYGKKLMIIGCGGIFSAKDAYKKIRLGASLVQLITGMIYQGPTLMGQINLELIDLLEKDGYENISQAIGLDA